MLCVSGLSPTPLLQLINIQAVAPGTNTKMQRGLFNSKQRYKSMIPLIKKWVHFEEELKVTMVYRNLNIQFSTIRQGFCGLCGTFLKLHKIHIIFLETYLLKHSVAHSRGLHGSWRLLSSRMCYHVVWIWRRQLPPEHWHLSTTLHRSHWPS